MSRGVGSRHRRQQAHPDPVLAPRIICCFTCLNTISTFWAKTRIARLLKTAKARFGLDKINDFRVKLTHFAGASINYDGAVHFQASAKYFVYAKYIHVYERLVLKEKSPRK